MTALSIQQYSLREEILHAVTHGIAAMLSVAALAFLLMKVDSGPLGVLAVSLYGGAMIAMFTTSTLYHSLFATKAAAFFKMLDHSAIYLKIAGSYAPFALISLPLSTGVWVMVGAWGAAVLGISLKLRAFLKSSVSKLYAWAADRSGKAGPRRCLFGHADEMKPVQIPCPDTSWRCRDSHAGNPSTGCGDC